jgi:SAM-dependent methyltransferase
MREQLARAVPGVPVHAGSAEEIPLPDHSVDAVLVAQAWHWVDRSRAVPEVARVLVPGGRLGLVWNIRDEREDWVAELGRIMRDPGDHHQDRGIIGPPFGPAERRDVEWTHRLSRDELIDLAASRSYVITMPDRERAVVLAMVADLADTRLGENGAGELVLPYVTECYRAELS